jgi:hypothetical protein
MPQENTGPTSNETLFGNAAAPFLYMQADQPPGGSGGSSTPSADSPLDNPDVVDAPSTTDAPGTTDVVADEGTAPADQPPGGSGG